MHEGRAKRSVWAWGATGAACVFVSGILAALFGVLLTASTWILGAQLHMWRQNVDAGLPVSTILCLIFGGYSPDWTERAAKKSATGKAHHGARGSLGLSHLLATIGLFLMLFAAAHVELRAQQTIFNVPSTDVLDKGKVYGELDVSFKPNNSEAVNRFSSFVPRVVIGAGDRVEVGLNVTGNIQPGPDTTTLVPTFKWKPYQSKDKSVAVVIGDHVFLPIRHRAYSAGNYVYAEISKLFKTRTRLTAGGYDFTKSIVSSRNRAGGQFGFEQPVSKTVTLAADYFTGKQAAGYFTPGVVFKISPKVTGYASYSIGNLQPSRGNNFFLLELGYNFNQREMP